MLSYNNRLRSGVPYHNLTSIELSILVTDLMLLSNADKLSNTNRVSEIE